MKHSWGWYFDRFALTLLLLGLLGAWWHHNLGGYLLAVVIWGTIGLVVGVVYSVVRHRRVLLSRIRRR